MDTNGHELTNQSDSSLFDRVIIILERARTNVVRTVNSEMVLAYWHIGREIVQELQEGEDRAEYGKQILAELSITLNKQYGKGFSVTNLRYFRLFYQTYANRAPVIRHKACDELTKTKTALKKQHKPCDVLGEMSMSIEKSDSGLNDNRQLFASKYMLYLPTEEELQRELERERRLIADT